MSIFTNSDLTYIIEKQQGLSGTEFDNNFRLVYYSASLHNDGQTLRLHRDINDSVRTAATLLDDPTTTAFDFYTLPAGVTDYDDISLPAAGGSGISILGNTNNNIITATGESDQIQGESNLKFDGSKIIMIGSIDMTTGNTDRNIFIGEEAGENASTCCTINLGFQAGKALTGNRNTILGAETLVNAGASSRTTAIGHCVLKSLTSGNFNTAIGAEAGSCVTSGASNVLVGYAAGPSAGSAISNKLYINNTSGTPLIYGDFSTGHVEIKTAVSASLISGSFFGDGSNLTGINASSFPFNGDAVITGSLTVSGSSVVADFTDTVAVSGSVFSGSFVGDGSGITGVTSNPFPFTGDAVISGSLLVSGSSLDVSGSTNLIGNLTVSGSTPAINLRGVTTIDNGIKIHRPNATSIGIGAQTLGSSTGEYNVALGYHAGCEDSSRTCFVAVGHKSGKRAGNNAVSIGASALGLNFGADNVAVGNYSMGGGSLGGGQNSAIGPSSLYSISTGTFNTVGGYRAGYGINTGTRNTSFGSNSLKGITDGNNNTALGSKSGCNTVEGSSNVYIGHKAGPSTSNTTESNQLYINNDEGTPLIKGDFSTCQVEFRGGVSGSFSGSYEGDGTNLTGITAEWDGSIYGDANITGSLTVSGSSAVVDFTDVTAISGSTFSGSFVGDGSGLTGLTGIEWDGSRDGDSNITGSLIVSGALDVGGTVTIASGSYPGGPGVELIQVNGSGITSATTLYTFAIDGSNNYTGFKADYALTNSAQSSKKVGTVLGSWDPAAGTSVVNEEHTLATGDVVSTSFSIDASDNTNAIFKVNVTSGTFEINALITAFKRVV